MVKIHIMLWYAIKLSSYFFKRFYFYREGWKKENINVWLLLMWSPLGTRHVTQVCALTGN